MAQGPDAVNAAKQQAQQTEMEDGDDERRRDAESVDGFGKHIDGAADVFRLRIGNKVGEAARDLEHAERDDEGRYVEANADDAVRRAREETDAETKQSRNGERQMMVDDRNAEHRTTQTGDGADGQIDPADDEHKRHARRDHGQRGNAVGERDKSLRAEKIVTEATEQDDQHRPDQQHRCEFAKFSQFGVHELRTVAP